MKILKKIIRKLWTLLNSYSHLKTLCNIKISGTKIQISKKVFFHQETIFYGRGKIQISKGTTLGFKYGGGYKGRLIELQPRSENAKIVIGENVATNNGLFVSCLSKVEIGNETLIGSNVTIMDHNAHGVHPEKRRSYPGTPRDIYIGKNVWIGNNVTILPGSIIGDNSIIGVGSIIKGIFPKNVIIQGNPAKIIKSIDI